VVDKKKSSRNIFPKSPSPDSLGAGDGYNSGLPSPEPFWSCARRLLAFDDPTDKWQKVMALCSRQLRTKIEAPSALSSTQQENLFAHAFGVQASEKNSQAVLFNTILAFEEMERLTKTCLELFFSGAANETESVAHWSCPQKLNQLQVRWVTRAARVVPNWQALLGDGPWSDDSRAQFIAACLAQLSAGSADLSVATLSEGRSTFRRLLSAWRSRLPASFLPNLIILVEGPTEALILPGMARCLSLDLDAAACLVLPAGGANQVLRRFLELRDISTLPLVAILDSDAQSQAAILGDSLRDNDSLHVLKSGEIEDVFDDPTFVRLINIHLGGLGIGQQIELADLKGKGRRTAILERRWREWGLGSFDKIGFARTIVTAIDVPKLVPDELVEIIESVRQLAESQSEKTLEGSG
jgi:hypothetical protein